MVVILHVRWDKVVMFFPSNTFLSSGQFNAGPMFVSAGPTYINRWVDVIFLCPCFGIVLADSRYKAPRWWANVFGVGPMPNIDPMLDDLFLFVSLTG